jgi:hypothetical protein
MLPFLDQQSEISAPRSDLSSGLNAPSLFSTFGPAAFEHSKSLFSVSAVSDLADLGMHRLGADQGPILNFISGAFGDSEDSTNTISPEQANEEYGFNEFGQPILSFNKRVSRAEAGFIREKKIAELRRLQILDRLTGIDFLSGLGVELLAELSDPLGLATLFLPAARVNSFARGFGEGILGAGIAIAPGTFKNIQIQATFQAQEAVLTMIAGGLFVGSINKTVGVTKIGIKKVRGVVAARLEKEGIETPAAPRIEFKDEIFGPTLLNILNAGPVNFAQLLTELDSISSAGTLLKELKSQRADLATLKRKIENETLKSPERDKILRQIDEAFLEIVEQEKRVKNKEFSKPIPDEKPTATRPEQEELDSEKITRVEQKESPEQKEIRQTRELQDLDKAMRLVSNRVPGSAEEFIRTLSILLGRKGDLDTTLQAALDDPEILQRIFNEIEQVRMGISKKLGLSAEDGFAGFNKAGSFDPEEIGGGIVREPLSDEIPSPIRKEDREPSSEPDIPESKEGILPTRTETINAPAALIKANIREVLGKIRQDVIRDIDSPKQQALFDQDEQLFQESQQIAAEALKKAMADKLKNPSSLDNIDPTIKKVETVEPDSLNAIVTQVDLDDLSNNFQVHNLEELENATDGAANDVESLRDLLEEQQLNPDIPEKKINETKNRLRIAEEEDERLSRLDDDMDSLSDSIGCAEDGLDV